MIDRFLLDYKHFILIQFSITNNNPVVEFVLLQISSLELVHYLVHQFVHHVKH